MKMNRICRMLAIRITVRIAMLVMLLAGSADARTLTMNAGGGRVLREFRMQ